MTLDGFLVGLVLLFAVFGFFTGAARQVASLIAAAAAYVFSRPLGVMFGPKISAYTHGPALFGVLAATLLAFVLVLISVRFLLTAILRRILRGKGHEHPGIDRLLGFLFGGLKVAVIAYVMLSALAFVQDNVSVAGKKLGISPESSQAFQLARQYNLFANTQFAPVKDLVTVAEALHDPVKAEQLRQDPAFKKLMEDPRFKAALQNPAMSEAVQNGDYGALLRSDAILGLIQDHSSADRMSEAAELVQQIPSGEPQAKPENHPGASGKRKR